MGVFSVAVEYSVSRRGVLKKGSVAIIDQALISGSNFTIGILLARWLAPEQYGIYALTFSVFLLLSQLQQALLLEPQSVLGPADFSKELSEYLGVLLRLSVVPILGIVLLLGACCGAVHFLKHNNALAMAIAGVGIAAPAILIFWMVRGACYVRLASSLAFQGSALYCLCVMTFFVAVHRSGALSPFLAYATMGGAAAIATTYLLVRLRPVFRQNNLPFRRRVMREHWRYGRWALAAAVVTWVPWNVYYAVLARSWSMEVSAEYRAMMNLLLPLGQALTALSLLAHPSAARKLFNNGRLGVLRQSSELVLLYALACIVYWTLILIERRPIIHALYGGHYAETASLLPWFAFASVLWFTAFAPPITLRAIQSPASVFLLYGLAAASSLLAGIPAAVHFGIRGAILGTTLSSAVALAAGLRLINLKKMKLLRRPDEEDAAI